MDNESCPVCSMADLLDGGDYYECATCGHEWVKDRVVVDANGRKLQTGDDVTLIKDLRIDGKSGRLKSGSKIKGIRIVDGDHPIEGRVDGRTMLISAEFVKLA